MDNMELARRSVLHLDPCEQKNLANITDREEQGFIQNPGDEKIVGLPLGHHLYPLAPAIVRSGVQSVNDVLIHIDDSDDTGGPGNGSSSSSGSINDVDDSASSSATATQ